MDGRARARAYVAGAMSSLQRSRSPPHTSRPRLRSSRATLADVQARVYSSGPRFGSGYGIGFQLTRRGERVFLGHTGTVAGYTAQAFIHAPSKVGFIVLRNAEGGKFDMSALTFGALSELANATPAKRN